MNIKRLRANAENNQALARLHLTVAPESRLTLHCRGRRFAPRTFSAVSLNGVLRPNREDWSGVDDGKQPFVGGSPTQKIALALMDRRNLSAVRTVACGWVWAANIRNEFLQFGNVKAIQAAAAVIKKLAPEGLCRNCELNGDVTPATLPAGEGDIKEQTEGLCDTCRALQIEPPLDEDAHDSIS